MTPTEIQAYIKHHAPEERRRRMLQEYYRGKHAISSRRMEDPNKPNNRLTNGYPSMIANAFTGYLFGKPTSYSSDDTALIDNVDDAFRYNDEQAHNAALGLDCSICGIAVEILYMDADAHVRFAKVDPATCIAVYDNSVEAQLTALIRYYDVLDVVKEESQRYVEVYDAVYKTVYEMTIGGSTLVQIEQTPHGFGDVPAVVFRNNADCTGDFEIVLDLIDAYDLMQSESVNEQEYFADAYMVITGMGAIESEDVSKMKKDRVLLVPQDAAVSWLIKSQDDTLVENIKNRLNTDIHRFSGCPDMSDENFAGNSSGVAIQYKLLQFENLTGTKEREFKRGLQRRLELLCNIWHTLGRGTFDWRSVDITFKRALPQNLLELAQTVSTLGSIVSDETKRSLLPLEVDEETEKERLKEEQDLAVKLFRTNPALTGFEDE